jgi:type VI protein secretion system component VasF
MEKTLSELCEPFFIGVGGLMTADAGVRRDAWQVRQELTDIMEQMHGEAHGPQATAKLAENYDRIEPVLAFFADDVINESTLPFANQWIGEMLLANHKRVQDWTGRQRLFLELDATIRDPSAEALERLAIFQTCLGLGFGGIHRENVPLLQQYGNNIAQRLEGRAAQKWICPEAYEFTQTDVLTRPVKENVLWITVICGALVLATIVSYVAINIAARSEISRVLGQILQPRQ